jgi:predicted TIM-barrel fold metal-dependent hydrolase
MSLRIVCLESHYYEAGWAKAAAPTILGMAPYIVDLGSQLEDDPGAWGDHRSHLEGTRQAVELAYEPIARRIERMDADGIDVQVLSIAQPIQAMPVGEAVALSRKVNDRLAEIARIYPSRFGGFFALPWQDAEAAAREAERAVTELGLTATALFGRAGDDAMLDHPRFRPILAQLEALQVPIYLHPGPPLREVQQPYYAGFSKDVTARFSLGGYGWHNEAGIQVIRLILSGALDRHPRLRIVSGHWGEMVPFYLNRLDDAIPMEVTGLTRSIGQTYRDQIYVTPSGMYYTPNFLFCKAVLGVSRMMFAMDYPYVTMTGARAWVEGLPLSEEERTAFAHGNAERLLRLPS